MEFDALVQRLELEAQSLHETIAVAQQRLTEIQTFLTLGRKLTNQASQQPGMLAQGFNSTRRERILDGAERILSDGRRRSTSELLAELGHFGITPGGGDPAQNLSTYLSRSERFSSDNKRGGWTLASHVQRELLTQHVLRDSVRDRILHGALDESAIAERFGVDVDVVHGTIVRNRRETKD